ncbi:MAG: M1 family metallopeptidase [Cyclobacteriaceae bacterium]|nr:M1 family metallopeptidase [Cyclobacteriaceae bacterium]
MKKILIIYLLALPFMATAQNWQGKFEQLGTQLPTPNEYRNAAGAPGVKYWQQQADYKIDVAIDENSLRLTGSEKITYTNNSPDKLTYLWVQLDQNVRQKNAFGTQTGTRSMRDSITAKSMMRYTDEYNGYDGGFKIMAVKDANGNDLKHTIVETMMRIDIPKALATDESYSFSIDWWYNMYDRMLVDGRGGYEYFPKDDNYAFTLAQWYPRMAVYDDVNGWQHKQFLGRGEFALPFGDFEVNITVPSDHIVGSTGWLQNEKDVLSDKQLERWRQAQNATEIIFIVTEKEAKKNEKAKETGTKIWRFKADNVRDFAFATSRKFIWDAVAVQLENHKPLAMSFYPKEGNPLWADYSTKAVANTLRYYSEKTIDYPYPVAISVHAANQGMEYPMICFNYGRPDEKGKYSQQLLEGLVGVVVHEVGHNFFPMIINSDERQWTWMDEGLNTFMEHNTMVKYYPNFDLTWGTPKGITRYMKGNPDYIRPIMTNSEQIRQFGYNAYGKPSAALVLLRETVMGPALFDVAFKEYAQRWAFKHPMPADFFRTMEDASAVDLDWFWRGWFYSIDHVDVELTNVRWFKTNTVSKGIEGQNETATIKTGNIDGDGNNIDFSNGPDLLTITGTPDRYYGEFKARVDDETIKKAYNGKNFYELSFKNVGGLVSPIIIEWTYADGTKEVQQIPAEIWRSNENETKKVFVKNKEVVNITIDPKEETGDTEMNNNYFPKREDKSRLEEFKDSY